MGPDKNRITKRIAISYSMITLGAILYTLGLQGFLQVARTFSSGLGAIAALPTFILPSLIPYVSFIYFALNLPLIIYFWNKNRRKFMYRTTYFLVLQTIFGAFFLFPDLHQSIGNLLNLHEDTNVRTEVWPIFILAIMGAVLMGMAIGICWKYGGSTGGTDLITYYFSTKRKIDVVIPMFIIALIFVLFSFVFSVSFNNEMREYWLITIFSSLSYVLITIALVNWIYPKYRKVYINVVSDKATDISTFFKSNKFNHPWQLETFTSGYHNRDKKRIVSIVFLLEVKEIIKEIQTIDPNCWISIMSVQKTIGNFDTSRIEERY